MFQHLPRIAQQPYIPKFSFEAAGDTRKLQDKAVMGATWPSAYQVQNCQVGITDHLKKLNVFFVEH